MTDSHAGGNSVGVHNHVGSYALNCKGQIFLPISHANSSLLTVARGEFVADLGNFDGSHFNFDESFFLLICSENDLIDVAFL
jgi:hypothetical protein